MKWQRSVAETTKLGETMTQNDVRIPQYYVMTYNIQYSRYEKLFLKNINVLT